MTDARYARMTGSQLAHTLTPNMIVRLVKAYAERLDGDTGPMSTEEWYLAVNDPINRALLRRGLVEVAIDRKEGWPDYEYRRLSTSGVKVAAHVVERDEITWGPKR